jgi:hypothetical protein
LAAHDWALVRIHRLDLPNQETAMKLPRPTLGTWTIYLATALSFLALDLFGLSYAGIWQWSALPAVIGQTLALTLIVGTWVCAMVFFEEQDDFAHDGRPASGGSPA